MLRGLAAVVAALCVGCALYVLFSYVVAFAGRPSLWRVRLARAAVLEMITSMLLVAAWPLWWMIGMLGRWRARSRGERPIIMLHGFGMTGAQWVWMAQRLRARGHGPIYDLNYFSPLSVERSARRLGRFVEAVLERERCAEADIIAHSLGGVVARYYIERLSGGRKIARLITIGTPHAGTRLGRFGLGVPAARDLCGDSVLLTELGPVRAGASYVSVWSRADAVVQPPESASIAPAGADEIFDDLGHLSLILSPRVVSVIDARLRT